MRKKMLYNGDLDVVAWVHDHETRRTNAVHQLRGIHAISRDVASKLRQN